MKIKTFILRNRKSLWVLVLLIAVVIVVIFLTKEDETTLTYPVVEIESVKQENVEIYGEYVGRVRAHQFVEIRARVEGYLEKMLLRYQKCKEAYFRYKNVPDNLFLSRTGRPLTVEAVERIVRTAGETANVRSEIRCSPHTCRHYFAQSQLRNGMDVYSLSRVMGHNSISITQRYLNSLNDKDIVIKSVNASPLMNIM